MKTHFFFIGNGFDIHHGIRSKYTDYKQWIRVNNHEILDRINHLYGMPADCWWSDFENKLTDFSQNYIEELTAMSEGQLLTAITRKYPDDSNRINNLDKISLITLISGIEANHLVNEIKASFDEWVRSIDIHVSQSTVFKINPQDDNYVFNFNYTRTIEEVYDEDICVVHPHGCVDSRQEFILGHGLSFDDMLSRDLERNMYREIDFFHPEDDLEVYGNQARWELYEYISEMQKPVNEILESYHNDFESLDIEDVTIAGFSFSSIDLPYLDSVFNRVDNNTTPVNVYLYSDCDEKKAKEYMLEKGIPSDNLKIIRW